MATSQRHTADGAFVIFHRDDRNWAPGVGEGEGPWFFEPTTRPQEQPYSHGYASAAEALEAAEDWTAPQMEAPEDGI